MTDSSAGRVIVVGGGIAGLVTAYRLLQVANGRGVDVAVFEASTELGGKIRTGRLKGFPIEDGPDSFVVRKPWALELCRELGLDRDVVAPAPGGVYVWIRGRLERFPTPAAFGVPANVEALLRWKGLSVRGRLRALGDLIRPGAKDRRDESIMSLLDRRLGREAADTLVAPLLAGLHAGGAEQLGIAATFPELRAWERDHGSLIRGSKAAQRAARSRSRDGEEDPMFATVWTGLSRMTEVLTEAIGRDRVAMGEPVSALRRESDGWVVSVGPHEILTDAVVLATPAFEAARLLGPENPRAANELAAIPYASTAVVSLAFPPGTLTALPPGTGFIVPPGAGLTITACTFVSSKWPRAEHEGRAVVRCFVGRAGAEEWMELDDDALAQRAAGEVRAVTGLNRPPHDWRVARWPRSMPQYEVGHLDRLARLDRALEGSPGAFVVGSAYRGVGIADCVRQAGETAAVVRAYLSGRANGPPPAARDVEEEALS
ncbi:MAG: protoporphyrinogen oxidase [Actinomycetota bacterium]